jgi:hypothetical protein
MKLREFLASRYFEQNNHADAMRHFNEAIARNPLDTLLGQRYQTVALMSLMAQVGNVAVLTILENLQSIRARKKQFEVPFFDVVQSTLETRERGTTDVVLPATSHLCETYFRVVVSQLYKDKPAVKTRLKAAYSDEIENTGNSAGLMPTIQLHQILKASGVKFTGQGVIEKQHFILLAKRLQEEQDVSVVEKILEVILSTRLNGLHIKSLIVAMVGKYPKNPIAQYVDFAYRLTHTKKDLTYRDRVKFNKLLDVCEASTEPKYNALVPALEDLKEEYQLDTDDGYGWYPA